MRPLVVFAVLAVIILLLGGCGKSLVVEDGKEYTIVSFGSADVETKEGEVVPCYVITFTYKVEGIQTTDNRGIPTSEIKTRGTISVPVDGLTIDRSLPINTIVWDQPRTIEGKTYLMVRWNPSKIDRAVTRERVREEEPLKK